MDRTETMTFGAKTYPLDEVKALLVEELLARDISTGEAVGLLLKIDKLPKLDG